MESQYEGSALQRHEGQILTMDLLPSQMGFSMRVKACTVWP